MIRSEIIKILKEFKDNYSEKYGILVLGIFGSVARDEANINSDVDVVVKLTTPDPFVLVHIKTDIEEKLQIPVDIVRMREKMNPFLKKRIEMDAVYV